MWVKRPSASGRQAMCTSVPGSLYERAMSAKTAS